MKNSNHLNSILKEILEIENVSSAEKPNLQILGFGEISTVFGIEGINWVYKKLPSFKSLSETEKYKNTFYEYLKLLQSIGINLPEQHLYSLKKNDRYILYVKQRKIEGEKIGNKLIHTLGDNELYSLLERIFENLLKVYKFNTENSNTKIGIDGQISNWADISDKIFYLDTTSPLFRINNIEQLNTEIFLKSTPSFLRTIIRRYFLREVLDRYYDLRRIVIDLIANFFKEGKEEIIPPSMLLINALAESIKNFKPIAYGEIKKYYQMDAFIWKFYQTSRRIDKFFTTVILKKDYELLLPEKIKR